MGKVFGKDMTKANNSSVVCCGLVAGYQGEGNKATPENAASAVTLALQELGIVLVAGPAVCVYRTEWGCPVGGEPVGSFRFNGDPSQWLPKMDELRQKLSQTTLSVSIEDHGVPTIGFETHIEGDLLEIGKAWQEAASEVATADTYVSCGITLTCCGELLISAEANPEFVKDLDEWQNVAKAICKKIGANSPAFYRVGFNYLK